MKSGVILLIIELNKNFLIPIHILITSIYVCIYVNGTTLMNCDICLIYYIKHNTSQLI